MPSRFSRQSSRYSSFPVNVNVQGGVSSSRDNYKIEGSGIRRHEVIFKIAGLDTIALGDF